MAFDVVSVRAAYPGPRGRVRLPGRCRGHPGPGSVIDAIGAAYRAGLGNAGGEFPASLRSAALTAECRQAVADLVGGVADGVILGPNMTTLTYRLAYTLARAWGPGDEVVVSRLDHDANVRPWIQAAARAGATVRWAEVDKSTGELPAAQYAGLLSERTRLVAVTAASNVLGTRPDVAAITAQARAVGALSYVDGVHATPHVPGRRRRAGRGLLRDQRVQVVRPACRGGDRRPGAAGDAAPGQADARARLGAGTVRAGHPALRRPGRGDRGGRPPGRAGRRCLRHPAAAGAHLDGRGGALRAGPVRRAARTAWPRSTRSPATGPRRGAPRPRTSRWPGTPRGRRPVPGRARGERDGAGTTTRGS